MGSRTSYCRTITTGADRQGASRLAIYRISSGGVTRYMLPALQRFAARHVSPGAWSLFSVRLLADETRVMCCLPFKEGGSRVRHVVKADIVRVTFRKLGSMSMVAVDLDGYSWGYRGEGPRGLASTMAWLVRTYTTDTMSEAYALAMVAACENGKSGRLDKWEV